jgi:hypothetical protein
MQSCPSHASASTCAGSACVPCATHVQSCTANANCGRECCHSATVHQVPVAQAPGPRPTYQWPKHCFCILRSLLQGHRPAIAAIHPCSAGSRGRLSCTAPAKVQPSTGGRMRMRSTHEEHPRVQGRCGHSGAMKSGLSLGIAAATAAAVSPCAGGRSGEASRSTLPAYHRSGVVWGLSGAMLCSAAHSPCLSSCMPCSCEAGLAPLPAGTEGDAPVARPCGGVSGAGEFLALLLCCCSPVPLRGML